MKKTYLIAAVLCVIFTSCYGYYWITGSGTIETRSLGYTDFSSMGLSMNSAVTIQPGVTASVVLSADDNSIDLVTVYPYDGGDTLFFDMDYSFRYERFNFSLDVVMPEFDTISFTGGRYWSGYDLNSALLTIEPGFVLTAPFTLDLPPGRADVGTLTGTSGTITSDWGVDLTADLALDDLSIDFLSGSAEITGSAPALDLHVGSSGEVDLVGLSVVNAVIDVEYGTVILNVTGAISGTVDDDAELRYIDHPGLNISNLQIDKGATVVILPVP